jgi:hypothetical protein
VFFRVPVLSHSECGGWKRRSMVGHAVGRIDRICLFPLDPRRGTFLARYGRIGVCLLCFSGGM